MIGLLRKDLYVTGRYSLLMLVLSLGISLLPKMENMGTTYPAMVAFLMPLYAFTYDERCKWDRYAAMLPYRREQIVWSKYIISCIYIVLVEITIFLSALFRDLIRPGSVDWVWTLKTNALVLVMMLLINAFEIPILYRFGAEKGRLVVSLILAAGLFAILGIWFALLRSELRLPPAAAAGMVALPIALSFASFRLSVHFYKKRRNGDYDT